MYHTHTAQQATMAPSQLAMQQLAQYERVGEFRTHPHSPSPKLLPLRTYTPPSPSPRPSSTHIPGSWVGREPPSVGGGVQRNQSIRHSPPSPYIYDGINAYGYGYTSPTGHGHLVPMKSASTPPQQTSTAMVLAGHHQQQQTPPAHHHQQLVPVSLAPQAPPPQVLTPQPSVPPNIVAANPLPTPSTPPASSAGPVDSSTASVVAAPPPVQEPKSNTILIHIPLIPTPFRIAIDSTSKNGPAPPYSLTDKVNNLLMNQSIQERIHNALSVPKPNGWILVERINTEYLQLRDLLSAIKDGRLMGDGVIPWVCAGELVEGGVGYWCLGVCT